MAATWRGWKLDAWRDVEATTPYLVLDVFTDTPLEGNQLAVFPDAGRFSSEQMQRLAREMSFSESAFVLAPQGDGDVRVRIFTPNHELPFAGHPVLGCAFVVGDSLDREAVRLETGLGVIPIELERDDGRIVFGRMQQKVPAWHPYERERELLAALGVQRSGLPVEVYPNGPLHVYVELESEGAVAALGGGGAGRRECLRPRVACSRIRPPVLRPGRSRFIFPGMGGSPSASRSRSARAPRSGARRSSTPAPTDRRTR